MDNATITDANSRGYVMSEFRPLELCDPTGIDEVMKI
jgi:hypothetical protein